MLSTFHAPARVATCALLLIGSWVSWPDAAIDAQSVATATKPLSYDAYDAWWSIQGTTLSRDGEWLAYALTSQGLEFFSAMRRLGKEAYMFVYNGEPHGLRQRDNMKHWTVHQDELFDHFLLGKPKPEWMEKGVPYLQKGRRDVSDLFKPKVATTAPSSVQDR
jgi:hypothetical protein